MDRLQSSESNTIMLFSVWCVCVCVVHINITTDNVIITLNSDKAFPREEKWESERERATEVFLNVCMPVTISSTSFCSDSFICQVQRSMRMFLVCVPFVFITLNVETHEIHHIHGGISIDK